MSLNNQLSPTGETKLRALSRGTSLNPNAAEFVPFSIKASAASSPVPDKLTASASSGKQILDRSESSISDDEVRQYWQQQLPDDITPDFNVVGEDLSLEGLSLHASSEPSRFAAAGAIASGYMMNGHSLPEFTPHHTNATAFSDKLGYPVSMYGDDPSSISGLQRTSKPWDMQLLGPDHHLSNGREGTAFSETSTHANPNLPVGNDAALVVNNDMNPVEFLASRFPGFAVESLAEVYFANSCDLNLTFEMLTQLELQVDGVANQNMNVKTLSAPNLTSTDFPSLPVPDNKTSLRKYTGDELQQTINPYGSFDKDNLFMFKSNSSLSAKRATDFASAVRKLASQDSGFWKYDRNGSADAVVGSSRNSHTGLYSSGGGRSFSDKMQGRASSRAAPVWLETGDAVANLYSDVREEARDRARLRNTYFEQARQAYLVGNKALAKELSVKGHLHNMQMKEAHCRAGESIYRERNPISQGLQGGGRCQEKMIDLHGLHVNEAIHVLKQELSVLRNAARLTEQRLYVYICVGTGHHTRGSRTPARLPAAVQRYLLQEEGLDFSEPQAGLLRVLLY